MTISAKIIADSISEAGKRLTTVQLCFPRFLLPELNTHRVFSRNTRSERAVPVKKMIEEVLTNPFVPAVFGRNQAGMQAADRPLNSEENAAAQHAWLMSAATAAAYAEVLDKIGVHKQHANRILSPYTWTHTLVTATEWDNFFELRDHADAQPEIQELAQVIRRAMDESTPRLLKEGQWHLPYVTDEELASYRPYDQNRGTDLLEMLIKVSCARNCRVSYKTFDGNTSNVEDDMRLFDKLVGSRPLHSSPLEHVARPGNNTALWGNFQGFEQYRKIYEASLTE